MFCCTQASSVFVIIEVLLMIFFLFFSVLITENLLLHVCIKACFLQISVDAVVPKIQFIKFLLKRGCELGLLCPNPGLVQVVGNLESHGIYYYYFQAWKGMEFKCRSQKVM